MNMMMSKPKILAVAGVVVALGLGVGTATAGTAESVDEPAKFTFDSSGFMVNGSGCPDGTAKAVFAPNGTDLTVAFSNYTATAGATSPGSDRRKACTTVLPVRVPAGFTWGIATTTYRGNVELSDGVEAYQGARSYFQGGDDSYTENKVAPDSSGNWESTNNLGVVTWAPCGTETNLVVTSSLKLKKPESNTVLTQDSFITMDTDDISLHSQNNVAVDVGLEMKKCGE